MSACGLEGLSWGTPFCIRLDEFPGIPQDAIQARIDASQKETEAKIKSLQEQAAKESGERKAKREARISELKADHKRRSDLLKQAWELTKEALSA